MLTFEPQPLEPGLSHNEVVILNGERIGHVYKITGLSMWRAILFAERGQHTSFDITKEKAVICAINSWLDDCEVISNTCEKWLNAIKDVQDV